MIFSQNVGNVASQCFALVKIRLKLNSLIEASVANGCCKHYPDLNLTGNSSHCNQFIITKFQRPLQLKWTKVTRFIVLAYLLRN